ncbi:MAG: uracil-DNA glycosylase family protein [Muribaculaceae bacterium]|nr:uracil-DNA glycosylase family protein [Muribaculaceae bacterium]
MNPADKNNALSPAAVVAERYEVETHPFEPYIPEGAKVLIMGTFPPQPKRWSMDFYYPNRTNDFWYMMGLIFYGDRNALLQPGTKNFDLEKIKSLLNTKGIALNDTGYKVRRLMGNASDKFLDIIEPVNLQGLLDRMPECRAIATTGEKAAGVLASLTGTVAPKMGEMVKDHDGKQLWRLPSTSRAYPLKLEKKADYYRRMFEAAGIEI